MEQYIDLEQWLLSTTFGRYILKNEREFYQNVSKNIFGEYSLQFGLSNINFLQGSKINNHYAITKQLITTYNFLPFKTESINLVICPHILNQLENYQQFLAECNRILIPSGKIIITSFNKLSLLKFYVKKILLFKQINTIELKVLSACLQNLNFSLLQGKFMCYRPLCNKVINHNRLAWIDKIGDRWTPMFANVYGIMLSKERMTPLLTKINNNQLFTESTIKTVEI